MLIVLKFCEIEVPVPANPPVTLVCTKFQLKTVLLGIELENATVAVLPEQIDRAFGVTVIIGFGVTKIVTWSGLPEQPL